MTTNNRFIKDPEAVLDYEIDWTDWLNSDTISASTWTVPTGLTKDSDSQTTTHAKIWLSSGTEGQTYAVENKIVTTGLRTDERTIYIEVREL